MNIDDSGPAFPGSREHNWSDGISVRDYFAAHAPPMDDDWAGYRRHDWDKHESPSRELALLAQWRYAYADAMLAARQPQPKEPT